MKTLKIGELKAHFSEVLNLIRKGEKVIISYGKKEEKVGIIIPYKEYNRKLGILKNKGKINLENFNITDEEFLKS
ncbi:MAG: type II toxin-antitoxin system Phd/YefM family antitoxin [Candidatus Eremiobacterota bacterium]